MDKLRNTMNSIPAYQLFPNRQCSCVCLGIQTDITVPPNYKSQVRRPFVAAKGTMVEERPEGQGEQPPFKFALMTKKGS